MSNGSGDNVGSPAGALSWHDLRRVVVHAVQCAAGVGMAAGYAELARRWSEIDLGVWSPVAAIVATTLIDAGRRWLFDTRTAR